MVWQTVVLFVIYAFSVANASWWLLASPSFGGLSNRINGVGLRERCYTLSYLVQRQKELCALNHNMLQVISRGAHMAMDECQNQFLSFPWNCTTKVDEKVLYAVSSRQRDSPYVQVKKPHSDHIESKVLAQLPMANLALMDIGDVFGGMLKFNSREKAYLHAISAAGVAYSITRACSQGDFVACGCDQDIERHMNTRKRGRQWAELDSRGAWQWGGCSDDVGYGQRLSKDFVDSHDLVKPSDEPASKLMNLHNNEAGRQAIRHNVQVKCKCHGLSGSCTVRVCWREMQQFSAIGQTLREKFDGASLVRFNDRRHKLQPADKSHKRPTKRDLVYLEPSPSYCNKDANGHYLTAGRKCNPDSLGTNGCAIMCCGRGYNSQWVRLVERCNCTFVWCCNIKCDQCEENVQEHYCR